MVMNLFSRRKFLHGSVLLAGALRSGGSWALGPSSPLPRAQPVDFSQVTFTDSFWMQKQQKVATATLSACIVQTEQKSARIRNFERAARHAGEAHEGIYYDDSDVYKALEAMAYSLKNHPDPALEAKA